MRVFENMVQSGACVSPLHISIHAIAAGVSSDPSGLATQSTPSAGLPVYKVSSYITSEPTDAVSESSSLSREEVAFKTLR